MVAVSTNWYWDKHTHQQYIIVTTRTSIHPRLDVVVITDIQDTPKRLCNSIQEKIIQRHYICLTDTDCDYILD